MHLAFVSAQAKNFLSVGNDPVKYTFDKSKILFVGKNGSGKSLLLDVICFALYGRAYRAVNKGQLVNTINEKDASVEIEFFRGMKHYRIVRTMKPDTLEVYENGTLMDPYKNVRDYQEFIEREIIGMSFVSFIQNVILGSARYVPFMSLTAPQRRLVLDDILRLGEITRMYQHVKEKFRETSDLHRDKERLLSSTRDLLDHNESAIRRIREINSVSKTDMEEGKSRIIATIKEKQEEFSNLGFDPDALSNLAKERMSLKEQLDRLQKARAKLDVQEEEAKKGIRFFGDNSICPTCEQEVDASFKEAKVRDYDHVLKQVATGRVAVDSKMDDLRDKMAEIDRMMSLYQGRMNQRKDLVDYIKSMKKELERRKKSQEIVEDLSEFEEKKATYEASIVNLKFECDELVYKMEAISIVMSHLEEKALKADIISTYIPEINARVSHYLNILGFNVDFSLDENFKETIRSRGRDTFSYESFSEGQKRRIDLALLFTWRDIAATKNSVSTDLLIMDEVFDSSLDGDGVEAVTAMMDEVGRDMTIIVISHGSEEMKTVFDRVFEVSMPMDFTVIREEKC